MSSINFFKKNKKSLSRSLLILAAVVVFLIGVVSSYLLLGQKMPWAKKTWFEIAKIVPLPIASVAGQNVFYKDYQTAAKLEVGDPLAFILEQAAISEIAKNLNISVDEAEIIRLKQNIEDYESFLRQKGISEKNFVRMFIEPDILMDKIVVRVNKPNAEVSEVRAKLEEADAQFNEIARMYSDDEITAPLGGDVGFVSENEIYSEIWQKAQDLTNGEWAGPISTPDGYVFVQKNGRLEASGDQPEKLNLQIILIETFDVQLWLKEQIKKMDVKIYI